MPIREEPNNTAEDMGTKYANKMKADFNTIFELVKNKPIETFHFVAVYLILLKTHKPDDYDTLMTLVGAI